MADTLCHNLTATTAPTPASFLYLDTGTLDRKLALDDLFATMMGWHNAKNYGIVGDGVTDDTAAIMAAFQTVIDAGGGTLFFPAGTYLLSSVAGTVAQIEFPTIGSGAYISITQQLTLRIVGALPPPTSGELTVLPVNGYTIFKSTVTTGAHTSIFRSVNTSPGRNNFHLEIRNIILQCPPDPIYHGWDLRYQQDVILRHLLCHSGAMAYSTVTQPTHSAAAILFPAQNHAVGVSAQNLMVWNWAIGYVIGELLADGIGLTASACLEALEMTEVVHPSYITTFTALECARVIKTASGGATYLSIGLLDIENANGQFAAWMDSVNHVDDSNTIHGTLTYHVVNANSGATDTFTKSGATNLICKNEHGQIAPVAFAGLPTTPKTGMIIPVSDSNTVTWGATIAGSSSNNVLAFYNGSNWTVAGK